MAAASGPNDPAGRRPSEKVRRLQRRLWAAAKRSSGRRFHALYDHIHRSDVLWEAWKRVRANRGAAGVDKETIADVERHGVERFLEELGSVLQAKRYRAGVVLRRYIPKADGRKRPLGIPTVRDRVVQMDLFDGKEGFDFLGCELRKRLSGPLLEKTGRKLYFLQRRPSQRSMQHIRQRVRELTPRSRCHADLREVIADLNPVLRGWGNYFRTGNAADRFVQLDSYVWRRLRSLRRKRKGRNLRPGEARGWTRESFWNLGLHKLMGTIRYPEAA
jgi:hypothetical protein